MATKSSSLTKKQLLKSLSMTDGGGAEVTLQTTIANEVVPLIRQQCFMRQIAEKSKSSINMTKPKLRIPRLMRAQGVYAVQPGQPAPEFKTRMEGIDLEPRKLMAWLPIEAEVFEDSTIKDMESMLRQELANEFAQGEEIAFMLGDTGVQLAVGDPRNVFDGLFKRALASPYTYDTNLDSADGQVVVSNLIRAMRFLGIYGRDKRNLVILCGTALEELLLRNKSFQTISAYSFGSGAGIFTGEIGRLAGAPVVASTFLDAQPGETSSRCLIMNASSFVIGDWQSFTIRLSDQVLMQTDQVALLSRERIAFAARYPEAIIPVLGVPV
jgi:hypothetical protein